MSGNSGNLKKGIYVNHNGNIKIVKNWHFVSDGTHNGDTIVVKFTDGTTTKNEGWSKIKILSKAEFRELEINKLI